jgi:putative effector of murein hydrolase
MLRHHGTKFGVVVLVAAISSIFVTIHTGPQFGLHKFRTLLVAVQSTTLAFAIPFTTVIGGSISNS